MSNVLIAEDDPIHLKRLTSILGKYKDKFNVIPVKNGQEAINIFKKQPVALLVTDIQMPEVDGLVLLAYVNKNHPATPCFVMTAYGTSRMKAKLPEDMLRFYQKPFEIDDLASAIIEVLERDQSQKALPGISIIGCLHMIQMEQTTCSLEIESPGKEPGTLFFDKGVLVDAVCGELKEEAAALDLIPRTLASFKFKFFLKTEMARQIKTDLDDLILKAVEG
jgi:YesN/AraC family two-component response regulator